MFFNYFISLVPSTTLQLRLFFQNRYLWKQYTYYVTRFHIKYLTGETMSIFQAYLEHAKLDIML